MGELLYCKAPQFAAMLSASPVAELMPMIVVLLCLWCQKFCSLGSTGIPKCIVVVIGGLGFMQWFYHKDEII